MRDLVDLLPPLTRGTGRVDAEPLTRGPRYVRSRDMGRWHRVRSGVEYSAHTSWHLWCGQHASSRDCIATAQPVSGELVCGTCEGRALGASQEEAPEGLPDLVFDPRRLVPPRRCPGSRSEQLVVNVPNGLNVGRCLVCGVIASVRVTGGPYDTRVGLVAHSPGTELVPGCPFHAWTNLRRVDTPDGPVAACDCFRPEHKAVPA